MFTTAYPSVRLRQGDLDLTGTIIYDHRAQRLQLTYLDGETEVLSIDLMTYGYLTWPGEVFVKDWNEHAGLTDALVAAGIVAPVERIEVGPFGSRVYRVRLLEPVGAHR